MWCALWQVRANARALGARLMKKGYKLVTDGTDNHLVLWDLRKEVRLCSCQSCLAIPPAVRRNHGDCLRLWHICNFGMQPVLHVSDPGARRSELNGSFSCCRCAAC